MTTKPARYWTCADCAHKFTVYVGRYTGDRCEHCLVAHANQSPNPVCRDLVAIVGKWKQSFEEEVRASQDWINKQPTYNEGYEDGRRREQEGSW